MAEQTSTNAFFFQLRNGARGRMRKCPAHWSQMDAELALIDQGLDWSDVWPLNSMERRVNSMERRDANRRQRQAQRGAIALIELWVPPGR